MARIECNLEEVGHELKDGARVVRLRKDTAFIYAGADDTAETLMDGLKRLLADIGPYLVNSSPLCSGKDSNGKEVLWCLIFIEVQFECPANDLKQAFLKAFSQRPSPMSPFGGVDLTTETPVRLFIRRLFNLAAIAEVQKDFELFPRVAFA